MLAGVYSQAEKNPSIFKSTAELFLASQTLLPAWVFLCLSRAAGPYVPRSGCNSHVFQRGAALWTIPLRYLGVQKGSACMVSQIRLSPGATIQCPPRFPVIKSAPPKVTWVNASPAHKNASVPLKAIPRAVQCSTEEKTIASSLTLALK